MHQNKDFNSALDDLLSEVKDTDSAGLVTERLTEAAEIVSILLSGPGDLSIHPELNESAVMRKAPDLVGLHALCTTMESVSVDKRIIEIDKLKAFHRIAVSLERIATNKQVDELAESRFFNRVEYLRMHRHHGLDIILVAQSPGLIHAQVLCLVEKHLHITPTWSGRKIFEWPEYCSTPRLKSSKAESVERRYKVPKESFKLYESASIHTKPTKTIPIKLFTSLAIILITPALLYYVYIRIMAKLEPPQEAIVAEVKEREPSVVVSSQSSVSHHNPPAAPLPLPVLVPVTHPIVSDQVDWSKVVACISSNTKCKCYGYSSELLIIPPDTCRIVVKHGWPGKRVATASTNL
jgi:zona occludens toxin